MANLTAGQLDELTFITGIDQQGTIAKDTYKTYDVEFAFGPDAARAYVSKWYNDANGSPLGPTSAAGTPGGTVTYAFDPGLSVQAQAAYTASLTLWSDVADIQFKLVSTPATANLKFTSDVGFGGITFVPANGVRPTGTGVTQIPTQASPNARPGGQAEIGIAAPPESFNSFTPENVNVMSTVVHETGHVLGLGHGGRYNGNEFLSQRGVYDTRSWSLMSYIHPEDQGQANYAQYPASVSDTNWTTPAPDGGVVGGDPSTSMPLDILAIQRLYGVSRSATFSGGQTYGFNTNIQGTSRNFYDFTVNQAPVVTLFNTGANNTLDLSGFATNETINLNPGSFSIASSSGTMVNNIAVAYDTRIDKAIAGAGNDVIYGNAASNTIDGGAGENAFILSGSRTNYTIVKTGAASAVVTDKTTGAVDTLTNIQTIQFDESPVCFTTGTPITVIRDGMERDLPVEALRVGDVAVTATGALRPIRWIGCQRVIPSERRIPSDFWPVRILAGAFGTGRCGDAVPTRDLRLSPGHPVLVGAGPDNEGGVLVPLMCLVNGTSIARDRVDSVVYWHVELDRHDILSAAGLPAESYIDCGSRAWFGDAAAASPLADPDLVAPDLPGRCRPVAVDGPRVEAERRRLDALFATRLATQAGWSDADTVTSAWLQHALIAR